MKTFKVFLQTTGKNYTIFDLYGFLKNQVKPEGLSWKTFENL